MQKGQEHVIGYTWGISRGKGSHRSVSPNDFDILALVGLDIRRVAYVPMRHVTRTMRVHVSGNIDGGRWNFDALTFASALDERAPKPSLSRFPVAGRTRPDVHADATGSLFTDASADRLHDGGAEFVADIEDEQTPAADDEDTGLRHARANVAE
jgi:hypothetical protein